MKRKPDIASNKPIKAVGGIITKPKDHIKELKAWFKKSGLKVKRGSQGWF